MKATNMTSSFSNVRQTTQTFAQVVTRLQHAELEVLLVAAECIACGKIKATGRAFCDLAALK